MKSLYRFTNKDNGTTKICYLVLGNNPHWKYQRTIKFKNLHKYYHWISLISIDGSNTKYYEGR